MRGRFITFEGVDGAGKSSHIEAVAALLRARGATVTATREPGGTAVGERLRELLLDPACRIAGETEAMLMFAARREHLIEVIVPALERGDWVICDRFSDATFAYQGGGQGVDWARLLELERWVHAGVQPDLTLFFDLPLAEARARLGAAGRHDRFERQDGAFFERVRAAYLRRAVESPRRIAIIDARGTVSEVEKLVKETVSTKCF
jgi:dTMP kinase